MTRRTRIYLTLTAAAALAVLFRLFPLTGDDWYREGLGRELCSLGDLVRELIFAGKRRIRVCSATRWPIFPAAVRCFAGFCARR